MCGIAGVVAHGAEPTAVEASLECMVGQLAHRGPDDHGVLLRRVGPTVAGVGNTRLAILDLSDGGHQPFVSPSGRHVLTYNGEIYNYVELRRQLRGLGYEFRSQCDTEVLLQALIHWGSAALDRLNGMWALAWLDCETGQLLLARDRLGVKPLYYYADGPSLFFASEIKAVLSGARRRFAVNTTAVVRFLGQSLRDAQSETFFGGIHALPAGHAAYVDLRAGRRLAVVVRRYWDVPRTMQSPLTVDQAVELFRELFLDSVRIRLRSDVPVGVLLSGGLDSSSIAAAVHKELGPGSDLHLISAVSNDPRTDEQPFIDLMASHLGQLAHKVLVKPGSHDLLPLLRRATYFNDEPVAGLSYVAHYLLMLRARELGVKVLLSGQGADELLCGYLKYLGFYLQHLLGTRRAYHAARVLAGFARERTVLPQMTLHAARPYLPRALQHFNADVRGPRLRSENSRASDIGLGSGDLQARQVEDLYRFSLPALLHTEDRLSMAASREMRVPYLDYRLVSLLVPLSPDLKLRNGWTKWLLRKAMEPYLPREIAWRRDKRHFSVPQEYWMRHDMRPDIEKLFSDDPLAVQAGLINGQRWREMYAAYVRARPGTGAVTFADVFNPLALEVWMQEFSPYLAEPNEASNDDATDTGTQVIRPESLRITAH